jgi:hypothetical protein
MTKAIDGRMPIFPLLFFCVLSAFCGKTSFPLAQVAAGFLFLFFLAFGVAG